MPSTISSIISHFVRISSESCDAITFVANEADSNNHAARTDDRNNTILHRIVNFIVEFIEHYAGYSDGKEVDHNRTYDIQRSIDKCLVIIHTLKSLRPQLLLMTNERG